jgi:glycosyltransferase involved in cell wall biosynthesis
MTSDRRLSGSVVVPVRNARRIVTEQLEALLREARLNDLEVIVVDDASSDGTPEVVAEWIERKSASQFRLVRRRRRGGPNASRNEGVARAVTDFLLFCDGDDVVAGGWASAMLAARADGLILCGALADLATWQAPSDLEGSSIPATAWGVPYAVGGNMATTRAVVESVGGFDENIRAGGTEFDFCFRAARDHDVPTVAVPQAIVWYRQPAAATAEFARVFRRERGRCYLRRKFGKRVVQGRRASEWVLEWLRVARLLITRPLDSYARRAAARRAASLIGRLWWSARFRVAFF